QGRVQAEEHQFAGGLQRSPQSKAQGGNPVVPTPFLQQLGRRRVSVRWRGLDLKIPLFRLAAKREVIHTTTRINPVAVPLMGKDLLRVTRGRPNGVVDSLEHARLAAPVGTDEHGKPL